MTADRPPDRDSHPDRAALEEQRRVHDERRHTAERERVAERRERDEQVRLRHLAEDDERRRRAAYDAALRRERVVTHLARSDPSRTGELLRAQQDVERAEAQWREADEVRRRWPSSWPW